MGMSEVSNGMDAPTRQRHRCAEVEVSATNLAKNFFRVHGVNGQGKAVLRKQLRCELRSEGASTMQITIVGIRQALRQEQQE